MNFHYFSQYLLGLGACLLFRLMHYGWGTAVAHKDLSFRVKVGPLSVAYRPSLAEKGPGYFLAYTWSVFQKYTLCVWFSVFFSHTVIHFKHHNTDRYKGSMKNIQNSISDYSCKWIVRRYIDAQLAGTLLWTVEFQSRRALRVIALHKFKASFTLLAIKIQLLERWLGG